jgi:DNA-binding transcriptional regulator YiaG
MTTEMTPKALCDLMYAHKLNAKKTAHLLHVSTASIYHWRTGTRKMPVALWELLNIKVERVPRIVLSGSDWDIQ